MFLKGSSKESKIFFMIQYFFRMGKERVHFLMQVSNHFTDEHHGKKIIFGSSLRS